MNFSLLAKSLCRHDKRTRHEVIVSYRRREERREQGRERAGEGERREKSLKEKRERRRGRGGEGEMKEEEGKEVHCRPWL